MSSRAQAQAKSDSRPAYSAPIFGLLQRTAVSHDKVSETLPIDQEVLLSPGQPLDVTIHPSPESRFQHDFSKLPAYRLSGKAIQTKLTINKPGDRYEEEADRMADAVVKGDSFPESLSAVVPSSVQRLERQSEKSADEKLEEGLKKLGEGILETTQFKQLLERVEKDPLYKSGKDFVGTLPGTVLVGAAGAGLAGAAVVALKEAHKELPIQVPEIPLGGGHSVKVTINGPLDNPSDWTIAYIFKEQASEAAGAEKPKPGESENIGAETARLLAQERYTRSHTRKAPSSPETLTEGAERMYKEAHAGLYPRSLIDIDIPKLDEETPQTGLQLTQPTPSVGYRYERPSIGKSLKLKPPGKKKKREEESALQRKSDYSAALDSVPPIVHEVISSPGQPLNSETRAFFEPRFGYDFSQIRVHTDARAAKSVKAVNALAYTVGRDVVFETGHYSPGTDSGQSLLAHELAHVVQQNGKALVIRRKKLKTPYRAQIVSVKQSGGTVQTCQDVNANRCRTDVLTPGMEVTITDEFVGGVWLFAQNLPEAAVKALHGQKWIYVPAKYVERLPEAKAQPAPKPKEKSETKTEVDALAEQLLNAIYSRDNEKVAALLNEGGLDDALDLVRRVQENAEAKGQVSPVGYLGDDFSLDASDKSSLRVAVTTYTVKLSIGDFSGSASDAYDALNEAAKRLGLFVQGIVDGYLRSHAGDEVKSVVEQRMIEQVGEFVEQHEQIKAAEKDPLGVFQRRLKAKTLQVLDENEAAVRKQRKALSGKGSADEHWKRLETVVVPQAIRYAQLGTLEEKLGSLVTHTKKAVKYAEEGKNDLAAIEYAEERGEPAYDDWWRPHKFPYGGGGANYPPPIDDIRAELEEGRKRLASVQEQRGYIKSRFPLAKAIRPALREKLAKGPASRDAAAVDEFRRSVFFDLEKQIFEVALSAITQLRHNVEGGGARLYSFTPLVDEVKSDLMLRPDQEAKIDAWVKEQKSRTETILVVTSGLSIAVLPLMFVPGGQVVVAIVGLLSAAYGADVVGEEYTAAKAGSAGKEIVEGSPTDMRWAVNLALLDLILSGLDIGSAVKALSKMGKVAKVAKTGEEIAEEAHWADKLRKKGAEASDFAKREEDIRKSIIRAIEAEADSSAAWKAVFRPPAALRMVIVPGAEEFGRFVYAVYLTIKRGIRDFQVFVKTNEAIGLIGDVTNLTAEELAALKTGYRKAIEEMETVAAHGKALRMADNDISAFMKLRGEAKGMTIDQVIEEMNAFKGTGLSVEVTEKQWARLRRVSEALNDESKWVNVTPKDRWRLGRVYDNLVEKLVSEGVKRTGQKAIHYVELNVDLVKNLSSANKRVLITEGRLPSEGLRFDMVEIDFAKGQAELIDLTATSSTRHLEKTRSGKVALEKLLGMPVNAKEMYYTGSQGELLETLVEVPVK